MAKVMKTMDGNTAVAWTSYAFTEVAGIFPITPSSPMAEVTDDWAANGRKNIFGNTVKVVEMQSEGGASGTVHGSLQAGALTTTYTASQGLLLMIPNMYKIAGELLPTVFHVSARALAYHALNIFGDHSDVMACRQTGFAMLCSNSVQEAMDLTAVAHLSAIKARVPFLHFFDGFRTSHEIQKIECTDYDELAKLVDYDALNEFRKNALNPDHPVIRGTAQNADIYFQGREASNKFYDAVPAIVDEYMEKVSAMTGRDYKAFNYYGAPDAENIVIAMGSMCEAFEEVIDYLTAQGEKVGIVKVHLYRPFSAEKLFAAVPETVKKITVIDRVKEVTGYGEPLYVDVCAAAYKEGKHYEIYGGRAGLGSKDITPGSILSVYDNMKAENPKNDFALGVNDDVTGRCIPAHEEVDVAPEGTKSCIFWGLGADGTVGANKNSIKIIGDHTDMYAQAYFFYDSKKSGGLTQSHLRFGKTPIKSTYLIRKADFIACHNQAYLKMYKNIARDLKDNGTFLLNTVWTPEELEKNLPAYVKRALAKRHANFYIINATAVDEELKLNGKTNAVLQAAFFKLADIIPIDTAVKYMKDMIVHSYGKKGEAVVNKNFAAVDAGLEKIVKVEVPENWADCADEPEAERNIPDFIKNIVEPVNGQDGDALPVSAFNGFEDGTFPSGTSAYEKRGVAAHVPVWDGAKCIQCNQCSFVCPHATIRPIILDEETAKTAPEGFGAVPGKAQLKDKYQYKMQISPLDCMGCGSCANICPAKALTMVPLDSQRSEASNWEFAVKINGSVNPLDKFSVKGSQFEQPLLEFSGACAGCGETPYVKLITQLFGDRMMVANATGCTSIWGGSAPSMPYTKNAEGHGPAWANSLFEDNAEFGLGMEVGQKYRRDVLAASVKGLVDKGYAAEEASAWLDTMNEGEASKVSAKALLAAAKAYEGDDAEVKAICDGIVNGADLLVKKSQWIFGGDGWAYDIGYGGLDHALASNEDINIFVVDTEVYSNTGGQASKSTPVAAVAKFAASGKKTKKKDLGMMAASYGYVYVAQVAMTADNNQLVKVMKEAEAYHGPSLVIAYAPCINHGIKGGMQYSQSRIKKAVECGYWTCWHFNPELKKEGKNPFVLDTKKAPNWDLFREYLMDEVRYSSLQRGFPETAEELYTKTQEDAKDRYEGYVARANQA
ncbi:MAG: pyruvate:ferredoxin (flavodoxin) oxidoreductase [Lachnospiraceae bacterium]|nr:pyruvate:ferredoxin (flavodoxin) oxidoreductase [Lachnospiraceae bacterium]